MSENQGPSSFEIMNQMDMGRSNNPAAAHGITGGGGSGMFPVGEQAIDLSFGSSSVDSIVQTASMDSMAAALSANGGALGQSISNQLEAVVDHHGIGHAKGDQGFKLENMGQGERFSPPNVNQDLKLKSVGLVGNSGGAEM